MEFIYYTPNYRDFKTLHKSILTVQFPTLMVFGNDYNDKSDVYAMKEIAENSGINNLETLIIPSIVYESYLTSLIFEGFAPEKSIPTRSNTHILQDKTYSSRAFLPKTYTIGEDGIKFIKLVLKYNMCSNKEIDVDYKDESINVGYSWVKLIENVYKNLYNDNNIELVYLLNSSFFTFITQFPINSDEDKIVYSKRLITLLLNVISIQSFNHPNAINMLASFKNHNNLKKITSIVDIVYSNHKDIQPEDMFILYRTSNVSDDSLVIKPYYNIRVKNYMQSLSFSQGLFDGQFCDDGASAIGLWDKYPSNSDYNFCNVIDYGFYAYPISKKKYMDNINKGLIGTTSLPIVFIPPISRLMSFFRRGEISHPRTKVLNETEEANGLVDISPKELNYLHIPCKKGSYNDCLIDLNEKTREWIKQSAIPIMSMKQIKECI